MVLVRVAYEGEKNIVDELKESLSNIQRKKPSLQILERVYEDSNFIDIVCDPIDYTSDLENIVFNIISQKVYELVIDIFSNNEIDYFFDNAYFFIKYDEIDEVKNKILDILSSTSSDRNKEAFFVNSKKKIINTIKNCIKENNQININGFMRFRLKEIFKEIELIVDRVVERHMVEKEYNEFIKLLKYFVEIQESKFQEVHIIINKRGAYTILDEDRNDIYDLFLDDLNDFNMSIMSANKDDLLISGLITNSPEKIIIHGANNSLNIEIIETIKQVFEDKVIFCCGCTECKETANKLIK